MSCCPVGASALLGLASNVLKAKASVACIQQVAANCESSSLFILHESWPLSPSWVATNCGYKPFPRTD